MPTARPQACGFPLESTPFQGHHPRKRGIMENDRRATGQPSSADPLRALPVSLIAATNSLTSSKLRYTDAKRT